MKLTRRLSLLEVASTTTGLTRHVKAWLGQTLSPDEQALITAGPAPDPEDIDTRSLRKELKAWLGLD